MGSSINDVTVLEGRQRGQGLCDNSNRASVTMTMRDDEGRGSINVQNCVMSFNKMTEILFFQVITKNRMFNNAGRLKVNMGNIYFKLGQYAKAIKFYRMALDQVIILKKI